uniref:Uncharacterized protein n=1 Tax=Arundo donax TaxID=35708 RepID=A0A0A9ART0_ARUDO
MFRIHERNAAELLVQGLQPSFNTFGKSRENKATEN